MATKNTVRKSAKKAVKSARSATQRRAKGTRAAKSITRPRRKPATGTVASALSPARQIEEFIAKYDPTVAKLARQCRAAMRKRLPTANELVYDNYQFLAIGYSSTERPSDCLLSLAVSPKGVALSFYYGSALPDPQKILLGSGKQNRFVRLDSARLIAVPAVDDLIRAADAHGRVPLPLMGKGITTIKSISATQRPRRALEKAK